jgi:hypothetical protein
MWPCVFVLIFYFVIIISYFSHWSNLIVLLLSFNWGSGCNYIGNWKDGRQDGHGTSSDFILFAIVIG